MLKEVNNACIEYRVKRKFDNYVHFELENNTLVLDRRGKNCSISLKKLKRIKVVKSGDYYGIKFFSPWGVSIEGTDTRFGTTMFNDIETKKGAKLILELLNQLTEKP